jgi:hypothetical protein
MAFGLLVRKWRILRSPLQGEFKNVGSIIMATCIMHNWRINIRLTENLNYDPSTDKVLVDAIFNLPATRPITDESPYRQLYASPEVASSEPNLV